MQRNLMDFMRHHYLYSSHHHPYRLPPAGARYGAVSPYPMLAIPRCTCECYCQRSLPQFAESDATQESTDREGRSREFVDFKNGTFKAHSTLEFSIQLHYNFSTCFHLFCNLAHPLLWSFFFSLKSALNMGLKQSTLFLSLISVLLPI